MATPVIMPKQGQSVESCIISQWHKQKGDKVETGDILFSYETDKASFDEEASVSGVLLDVFFKEGDDVPCLLNVCVIGEEGESTEEFNPNAGESEDNDHTGKTISEEKVEALGDVKELQEKQDSFAPPQVGDGDILKISPRARNLAEKTGVDYRMARPSGPYGRIIEQDIVALKESGVVFTPAAMADQLQTEPGRVAQGTGLGGRITTEDLNNMPYYNGDGSVPAVPVDSSEPVFEDVKISNIRKVIAKAMHHSLSSTAQLTLNTSFDATDIINFRKKLKAGRERLGLENITINDIIIYAVSRTLLDHKDLNAHFMDDTMRYFKTVNIGVAVDTERGLMVPTVFNANYRSLNSISKEVKKLAADCQAGTISPDLLKNASFTITNLGTLDIESFTPVLNPPQTGILGVNTIVQRAREVDGEYEFYPAMGLSLTFDHRAVDGAPAGRFLKDLKNNLENFSILLVR